MAPGARELEYLAYIVERAAAVRSYAGLAQWAQGLLQMLLPHQAMVGLLEPGDGRARRAICVQPPGADEGRAAQLCALAERAAAARQGRLPWTLPAIMPDAQDTAGPPARTLPQERGDGHTLAHALGRTAPGVMLVHGTGDLACGAARFILFGMPPGREAASRYYMELLLPSLYLALQRVAARPAATGPAAVLQAPLTGRELEILQWLQQGKINAEIGAALGISARTVKNHVFNIYRKLDVQNRVQAVTRAAALSLTAPAP